MGFAHVPMLNKLLTPAKPVTLSLKFSSKNVLNWSPFNEIPELSTYPSATFLMASTGGQSESLREWLTRFNKAYRPSSISATCVILGALLSVYCLPGVLWCVCVCVCPVRHPVLVLSVLQTSEGRRMSACQYPAASLLLVFRALRDALLHVPRRNMGNGGWREEE